MPDPGRPDAASPGEPDVLHLVTTGRRTGQPREVEIWFTRAGRRLYLIAETGRRAGGSGTSWPTRE